MSLKLCLILSDHELIPKGVNATMSIGHSLFGANLEGHQSVLHVKNSIKTHMGAIASQCTLRTPGLPS